MPRVVRVIAPGLPHHITQRGNYGQTIFRRNEDRRFYLTLLSRIPAALRHHARGVLPDVQSCASHSNPARSEGLIARSSAFTVNTHVVFTCDCAAPAICGRLGFIRWRWMKNISGQQCFMWSVIQCGLACRASQAMAMVECPSTPRPGTERPIESGSLAKPLRRNTLEQLACEPPSCGRTRGANPPRHPVRLPARNSGFPRRLTPTPGGQDRAWQARQTEEKSPDPIS